jgi:hypothetical protein
VAARRSAAREGGAAVCAGGGGAEGLARRGGGTGPAGAARGVCARACRRRPTVRCWRRFRGARAGSALLWAPPFVFAPRDRGRGGRRSRGSRLSPVGGGGARAAGVPAAGGPRRCLRDRLWRRGAARPLAHRARGRGTGRAASPRRQVPAAPPASPRPAGPALAVILHWAQPCRLVPRTGAAGPRSPRWRPRSPLTARFSQGDRRTRLRVRARPAPLTAPALPQSARRAPRALLLRARIQQGGRRGGPPRGGTAARGVGVCGLRPAARGDRATAPPGWRRPCRAWQSGPCAGGPQAASAGDAAARAQR